MVLLMEEGVVEEHDEEEPVVTTTKFTQEKNRTLSCKRDPKTGKWVDYE